MKKFLFMMFICGLATQNSLNAVECKPLAIDTNAAVVIGYVDCNNMEAPNKSLDVGKWNIPAGPQGVRPDTMVRVERKQPVIGTTNVVYHPIGEGLTIECLSYNDIYCKCNGSPCNHL